MWYSVYDDYESHPGNDLRDYNSFQERENRARC
jgi:hypothetical protein